MSRSGYSDDYDGGEWAVIRWCGAVASAIRGKRGQEFLKEMLTALDALEHKRLITSELTDGVGEVCALGAVGMARGIDMSAIDPEYREQVAQVFGISEALAAEIMYENDECGWRESEETRYQRVRRWVESQIKEK